MSLKSKIEWTENTWNPVTGCTKISDGCDNCYAFRMAQRLQKMGNHKYKDGFKVTLHPDCLNDPINWKKPSRIFVNSMSDLFHKDVPLDYIKKVFDIMNTTPQHAYQILTKRADMLLQYADELTWTDNIWQGITVENQKNVSRIDYLRKIPAKIKFISFEPLIGDVGKVDLINIDWVIVGGESGWYARPMDINWVLSIKDQCEQQGILFYFKQWGGTNKKKTGRELLGQTWDDMPEMNVS
jgi:protein gp37